MGPCNVVCLSCHALHWIQERSYRSTINDLKFFTCCQRGHIDLPSFPDAPEPLISLLQENTDGIIYTHFQISIVIQQLIDIMIKSFRFNIRNYNNAFAFSSLSVHIDSSIYGPFGIYTFRIHDELIHRIDSLLSISDDQQPRFSQIYVYDSDVRHQAETRMSYHHGLLDLSTVLQLQHMLRLISHVRYCVVF